MLRKLWHEKAYLKTTGYLKVPACKKKVRWLIEIQLKYLRSLDKQTAHLLTRKTQKKLSASWCQDNYVMKKHTLRPNGYIKLPACSDKKKYDNWFKCNSITSQVSKRAQSAVCRLHHTIGDSPTAVLVVKNWKRYVTICEINADYSKF